MCWEMSTRAQVEKQKPTQALKSVHSKTNLHLQNEQSLE